MDEALKLIAHESTRRQQPNDGWLETIRGGAETLTLNEGPGDEGGSDLFVQKMLDAASYLVPGEAYQPLRIDRDALMELRPEDVYIVNFRKFSPFLPIKMYRIMIPEVAVAVCGACGHFFHQETWELEFLQNKCCPYCGSKEIDAAKTVASASKETVADPVSIASV